ncbi:MAG: hypothetical protein HUU21_37225 [Polyangiaceae bacterium]|nr:hypothetical protein [Polyangiaceae bacterium]
MPPGNPPNVAALGYGKLGPRAGEAPDRADNLARVARNPQYSFDVHSQAADRFIRRRARKVGVPPEPMLLRVDAFDQAVWVGRNKTLPSLQAHRPTSFYQKHATQPKASRTDCMNLVRTILNANLATYLRVVRFEQGIAFAADADLDDVLREAIDHFFQWQPTGAVRVYSVSQQFESYHGFLRAGYVMEHVAVAQLGALQQQGFASLRAWHPLSSIDASRLTLTQMDHIFYPYVTGFIAGPLGLLFHFVLGDPVCHDPGPWPPDWPAVPRSLASFGGELIDRGAAIAGQPTAAQRATHHRFLFTQAPALQHRLELEDWWIERANVVEYELLDPTNAVDRATGCIDFRDAFEHALTTDRIRRSTLASNTFPYPSATKSNVFAIADLYETLCRVHAPQRAAAMPAPPANFTQNYFKQLFHRTYARALTDYCLQGMPAGPRAEITRARDAAYDELSNSVLGAVFTPGARQVGGGVSVVGLGGAAPTVEPDDVFVANVMRALRNTHHGYMTSQDRRLEAPSRYLAITNGNVTDDISFLPAVWWLSFIGDPSAFCGMVIQPVGQHPV